MKKIRWPLLKTFLVIGCAISEMQVNASNATWTNTAGGANANNLNVGGNWSGGSVPTDTAIFNDTATSPYTPSLNGVMTFPINEFSIMGTTAYTFSIGAGSVLEFNGSITDSGVFNDTGIVQTFDINGNSATAISFNNTASADSRASGKIKYNITEGTLSFSGNSSASNAQIVINGSAPNASVLFEQSADDTFSGSITGLPSATGTVTVDMNSTTNSVTFSGTNTYYGNTVIMNGILTAETENTFSPYSIVEIQPTGTLNLNSKDNTIGGLSSLSLSRVTLGSGTLYIDDASSTGYDGSIVGTGGLTKTANSTGTLDLTGSGFGSAINTYSGPTTLNAGRLRAVDNDAFSPNSAVILSPGATLDLNNYNNAIPSLSGMGGSVYLGSGMLTLSDVTGTTIFAGTITGVNGSLTIYSSTPNSVFILSGPPTQTTYSGPTTLNNVTMQAGGTNVFSAYSEVILSTGSTLDLDNNDNAIGSLSGTGGIVTLGSGTLTLGQTISTTFSGTIEGTTGGLTLSSGSTGTFTLLGTGNTYSGATTLEAGTLQAGIANAFSPDSDVVLSPSATLDLNGFSNTIAALSGTGGTVNVGTAILTFGNSESTTYAGSFLGSGTLDYNGSGTFNLAGNSSAFTGTTEVDAGFFSLNNVLGGDVFVNNGGTIKGNGTVGGNLTINSGGTIAPGNSIGTMNVNGNYVQEAGSTYDVSINSAGQSDLINVAGTAIINGGEVVVLPEGGYDINKEYLIVNANGGRTGEYSGVSDPSSSQLVRPILVYTPTQVLLELEATIINVACSSNTKQVAKQLDAILNPTTGQAAIINNIINLTPKQACKALYELTGQQHGADSIVAELVNRQFIRRLYDPIRCIVNNTCGNPCACDPCECDPCACAPEYDAWLESGGGYFSIEGNHNNASGFKIKGFEVTGGVQKTFLGNLTFGVAGSYANDRLNFNHGGHENFNSGFGGLYALYRPEKFYAFADFAYGYTQGKLRRHIHFGSINSKAHSRPEINQFTFYAEAGFDISLCDLLIQPFFGVEGDAVWIKRIWEHGAGDLDLDVKKRDYQNTFSRLGFHVTKAALPCDISLSLDMAWLCRLNSQKNRVHESFASFGSPFSINGLMFERNSFEGALTASKTINDAWMVYLEVAGEGWKRAGGGYGLAGVVFAW